MKNKPKSSPLPAIDEKKKVDMNKLGVVNDPILPGSSKKTGRSFGLVSGDGLSVF